MSAMWSSKMPREYLGEQFQFFVLIAAESDDLDKLEVVITAFASIIFG